MKDVLSVEKPAFLALVRSQVYVRAQNVDNPYSLETEAEPPVEGPQVLDEQLFVLPGQDLRDRAVYLCAVRRSPSPVPRRVKPQQQQQPVRLERRVGGEVAPPVARRVLPGKQVLRGAARGFRRGGE